MMTEPYTEISYIVQYRKPNVPWAPWEDSGDDEAGARDILARVQRLASRPTRRWGTPGTATATEWRLIRRPAEITDEVLA